MHSQHTGYVFTISQIAARAVTFVTTIVSLILLINLHVKYHRTYTGALITVSYLSTLHLRHCYTVSNVPA